MCIERSVYAARSGERKFGILECEACSARGTSERGREKIINRTVLRVERHTRTLCERER